MTITFSDKLSQTSLHPNKFTFEFKSDINSMRDGPKFGHLMSDVFQAKTESPAEIDPKQTSLTEKPGQEIADPSPMAEQVDMVAAQAGPWQAVSLKAVTLGPHMSVITPASSPPDSHSLAAFARAQGLDENAIHWLFGGHVDTMNAPLIANPSIANVVTPGNAVGATELMTNVQGSSWQLPLAIQSSAATRVATNTAHGPITSLATHSLGQLMTGAQVIETPYAPTTGLATHSIGQVITAAQVIETAYTPTTGMATHSLDHVVTAAQGLWTMTDVPEEAPKPSAISSTEEIPLLQMLRMPTPAAVWMQGNVNPSLLQHNERAPKEAPVSLSVLDLGADWEGEMRQQLSAAESRFISPDTLGTASANFATRLDAQANHPNDPSNINGPAPDLPDTQARSENIQNLADKMGQAVGQRILSEMERGQWHLKLSLRPATLGHIEVEMKMRSGEFDALFTAPNAVTRELLQEGLGKLRETLNQMGMNFAQIDVADGKSGKDDGNPTPRSFRGQPAMTPAGYAETTIETITRAPSTQNPAKGLDVLV